MRVNADSDCSNHSEVFKLSATNPQPTPIKLSIRHRRVMSTLTDSHGWFRLLPGDEFGGL